MCGDAPAPPPFDPSALNAAIPSVAGGNFNLAGAQQNASMLQSRYPWIVPPAGAFAGASQQQGNQGGMGPMGMLAGLENPLLAAIGGVPGGMRPQQAQPQSALPPSVPPPQAPGAPQNPLSQYLGQGGGQIPLQAILSALSGASA